MEDISTNGHLDDSKSLANLLQDNKNFDIQAMKALEIADRYLTSRDMKRQFPKTWKSCENDLHPLSFRFNERTDYRDACQLILSTLTEWCDFNRMEVFSELRSLL